jgi:hypothetical protein
MLSLWDEDILRAEASIKLALMLRIIYLPLFSCWNARIGLSVSRRKT